MPESVGGAEKVVQQITESMFKDYGMECHILSTSVSRDYQYNGVYVHRLNLLAKDMIAQINSIEPDHILTYGDLFRNLPILLANIEKIKIPQSVVLVGANRLLTDAACRNIYISKKDTFKTIIHSTCCESLLFCQNHSITSQIIPNGIDFNEVKDQGFSFREKYGLGNGKIILCVSNFFPGKGQEYLLKVLDGLLKRTGSSLDWTVVFIWSTVKYDSINIAANVFRRTLGSYSFKSRVLIDIPRHDTIQSFRECDIFVFPSQKEVAPLVILESMASSLPWISLDVGNISDLKGGIMIPTRQKIKGAQIYTTDVYRDFEDALLKLLTDEKLRKQTGEEGYHDVRNNYNWSNIKNLYRDVFVSFRKNFRPLEGSN